MKCGRPAISFTFTAEGKPVLSWNPVAGAASYEVQVSTKSKSGYTTLAVVETNTVIHEAAASGKTYYYKIRAIDAKGVAVEETEDHIRASVSYELEMNYEKMADCEIRIDIRSKDAGNFQLA
jgi:fibronectin type 3 domain-containing protein